MSFNVFSIEDIRNIIAAIFLAADLVSVANVL